MRAACALTGAVLASIAACLGAQEAAPKAEIRAVVASDVARAGTSVDVALDVQLPEGVHVQASKPRDPLMIPTALAIEPPTGVAVAEIAYPDATDFAQAGQNEPLAVFEQRFVIGARLTLDRTIPLGDTVVPARIRYQACNASTCFAPVRVEARWLLRVVPEDTHVVAQFSSIFERIRFRR
jgi:DsbC/DsbD-like thiol-disulfide interchange protein